MPHLPNHAARLAASILVVAVTATACGYQLDRAARKPDAQSVAVRPLRNDSFEPGIEVLLTDALRREVLRRGGLRLVDRPGDADLVVAGIIEPLGTHATSVSSVAAALEQQVAMTVEFSVRRRDGSELALAAPSLEEWELYLESADIEAARKNRDEALRRLVSVLATRFHELLEASLEP